MQRRLQVIPQQRHLLAQVLALILQSASNQTPVASSACQLPRSRSNEQRHCGGAAAALALGVATVGTPMAMVHLQGIHLLCAPDPKRSASHTATRWCSRCAPAAVCTLHKDGAVMDSATLSMPNVSDLHQPVSAAKAARDPPFQPHLSHSQLSRQSTHT